jgi:hypothetical protein
MAIVPGFVGPSYPSRSQAVAGERCINLFPEVVESNGKAQAALYSCPGLPDFATGLKSPGRGLFAESGQLFAVGGNTLYEVDANGTPTSLGSVSDDGLPVTMVTNGDLHSGGDELAIASANRVYLLNRSTLALTNPVNDVRFIGQIGSFFVGLDSLTGILKISESYDGGTWDPTQAVQRSSSSDQWIAMLTTPDEIFLFGEKTGEVWYNAGLAPFPFRQRQNSSIARGITAPRSLARFGDTMAWLGSSGQGEDVVYLMNGYTPNRISNHAVEWAISEYRRTSRIDDAIGWSHEMLGHIFYVLEFPSADATWVYDQAIGQWHERGLWDGHGFAAYRPRFHATAFNRNIVCDRAGTSLLHLSTQVYTDAGGAVLRRVRRLPHTYAENRRIRVDSFEIDAKKGVGLTAGQGVNPLVMMRYSNDGGETWSGERTASLGAKGQYSQRIKWDRCGVGRDRVWEVSVTDPVDVSFFNAFMQAQVLAH